MGRCTQWLSANLEEDNEKVSLLEQARKMYPAPKYKI